MQPVAYITGTFPAWSETFISQEIALLLEAGVPLEVICVQESPAPLPPGCPPPHVLKAPDGSSGQTRATRPLPLPRKLRRMASLRSHAEELQRLIAYCRERGVGRLHGAFLDLPGLLTAAAARELGLPFTLSFHANDALLEKYDLSFLCREARALIACNRVVHDLFVSRHPELADKTHLVPHGILLKTWTKRPASWMPHRPLRLLFVGRLVQKKRPDLAVQVLHGLREADIDAQLTVIGDGPMAGELVDPAVLLAGVRLPGEVRDAMHQADLLLVTSEDLPNGEREGLPNILLEAMASGLPVVATPAGSVGELLTTATGYPVADHLPASIARCIQGAIDNPEETQSRCDAARRAIETHYDATQLILRRARLLGHC